MESALRIADDLAPGAAETSDRRRAARVAGTIPSPRPLPQIFFGSEIIGGESVADDDDPQVIRVSIIGNPEHTRQIAKAAEEAARG